MQVSAVTEMNAAAAGVCALAVLSAAAVLRRSRQRKTPAPRKDSLVAKPTTGVTRRFQGHVVLITGAGSGIGRATAVQFAKEGATVAVNDLPTNEAGIRGTIDLALEANPNAVLRGFPCDVSDRAAVEKVIDDVCANFGRVDVVVTNAYFSHRRHFLELDWAQVRMHERGYSLKSFQWLPPLRVLTRPFLRIVCGSYDLQHARLCMTAGRHHRL